MIPVIDTSSIIDLFRWYNRKVFPGLWREFDNLVNTEGITSVVQVLEELKRGSSTDKALGWAMDNQSLFPLPTARESAFLGDIHKIPQFRDAVPEDVTGTDVKADLFLIARAKETGGMVVTQERFSPRGNRIPNICDHFDIRYGTLDDMMVNLGWEF